MSARTRAALRRVLSLARHQMQVDSPEDLAAISDKIDPAIEKRIKRKCDLTIAPWCVAVPSTYLAPQRSHTTRQVLLCLPLDIHR